MLARRPGGRRGIAVDGLHNPHRRAHSSKRVLSPHMSGTPIDEMGLAQLVDLKQPLKSRMVNDFQLAAAKAHHAGDRQQRLLDQAARIRGFTARLDQYRLR